MTHRSRTVPISAIVLATLASAVPMIAAGCRSYTSRVPWHGVGGAVYINTPVWACISDAEGKCSAKGGYLFLKNNSSRQSVRWSSTAAGQATPSPLGPGEQRTQFLAIYRQGNDSLTADLTVEVCD